MSTRSDKDQTNESHQLRSEYNAVCTAVLLIIWGLRETFRRSITLLLDYPIVASTSCIMHHVCSWRLTRSIATKWLLSHLSNIITRRSPLIAIIGFISILKFSLCSWASALNCPIYTFLSSKAFLKVFLIVELHTVLHLYHRHGNITLLPLISLLGLG